MRRTTDLHSLHARELKELQIIEKPIDEVSIVKLDPLYGLEQIHAKVLDMRNKNQELTTYASSVTESELKLLREEEAIKCAERLERTGEDIFTSCRNTNYDYGTGVEDGDELSLEKELCHYVNKGYLF